MFSDSDVSVFECFEGLGLVFHDDWITQRELHPGGADHPVELTAESLRRFLDELSTLWFGVGVAKQVSIPGTPLVSSCL